MQGRPTNRRRFFVPQNDKSYYKCFVILNAVKNLLKATIEPSKTVMQIEDSSFQE